MAIFRPDVEAASHSAVRANSLRFADAVLPHCLFGLGDLKYRSIAGLRLNAFDHLDHAAQSRLLQRGKETSMSQHAFFHKRIAGTNSNAVAARNAARLADGGSAVPQDAGIGVFPVDRERFVDLDVLAGFYAPAAENALVGIVAIERICVIDLVRFRSEWDLLMLNRQQLCRVMNGAISIVIVADCAIEKVITEDAIKGLYLRGRSLCRLG